MTKTFELLAKGDTMGSFSLNHRACGVARSLRPTQFSDIMALVAFYRPGPMDLIPSLSKANITPKIAYAHESLKPILEESYGVMVYQEQILEIAHVMAGYTLARPIFCVAPLVKKKPFDKNRQRFISESVKNKYDQAVAEKSGALLKPLPIMVLIKLTRQLRYDCLPNCLPKANYPIEYMTALMSVESGSSSQNRDEKVAQAIEECKRMKIHVLPPDINHSDRDFTIERLEGKRKKFASVLGWTRSSTSVQLRSMRFLKFVPSRVPFIRWLNLLPKPTAEKSTKPPWSASSKSALWDGFGTRASMLENLEEIRKRVSGLSNSIDGQTTLFSDVGGEQPVCKIRLCKFLSIPKLSYYHSKKSCSALYLTEHPMALSAGRGTKSNQTKIAEIDLSIHQGPTFSLWRSIEQIPYCLQKPTRKWHSAR